MTRKWSPRGKLFAGLAAVLALFTFALARSYAQRLISLDPGAPTHVLVAAQDLARGTSLEGTMLKTKVVPAAFVPPGAVVASVDVSGRTVVASIDEGEVVTDSRLGDRAGPVASLVPPGLRAVMVPTDLPPGAVVPGDRVDVLATYAGGQPYTETVATSVEVLDAVDPGGGGFGDGPRGPVLVLLADPSSTERIAHAMAAARVEVAIVGPSEMTQGTTQEVTTQTPQTPASPAPAAG